MTEISRANAVGFTSELAALLLQTESTQAESAQLQRAAARERFLQDSQEQADAMRAAASATFVSAGVSAGFTMAGAGFQIGGAVSQFKADTNAAGLDPENFSGEVIDMRKIVSEQAKDAKVWNALGAAAGGLAQATTVVGGSIAEHDRAKAKQLEADAAQAQWEAEDASSAINKANKQSDSILDTYQGIQRDQNAANNAIIGRI